MKQIPHKQQAYSTLAYSSITHTQLWPSHTHKPHAHGVDRKSKGTELSENADRRGRWVKSQFFTFILIEFEIVRPPERWGDIKTHLMEVDADPVLSFVRALGPQVIAGAVLGAVFAAAAASR